MVLPRYFYFKGLPVISFSLTDFARNIDVGEEVHLDADDPITGTGFTAAAF